MEIDVKRIAKLSALYMTDEELIDIENDMQEILEMAADLPELDGELMPDPDEAMQLRDDILEKSELASEDIFLNAPQSERNCFVVPKVVNTN